jgi:hypothetical protein
MPVSVPAIGEAHRVVSIMTESARGVVLVPRPQAGGDPNKDGDDEDYPLFLGEGLHKEP